MLLLVGNPHGKPSMIGVMLRQKKTRREAGSGARLVSREERAINQPDGAVPVSGAAVWPRISFAVTWPFVTL